MLILKIWVISFHAVVVFGLGKDLLFKSGLVHCGFLHTLHFNQLQFTQNTLFYLSRNEKFFLRKVSKIPLSNSIFPPFFGFCPRGHLMDYHLPSVDNCGHLANYHLPHFVHVVIEQPLRAVYLINIFTGNWRCNSIRPKPCTLQKILIKWIYTKFFEL